MQAFYDRQKGSKEFGLGVLAKVLAGEPYDLLTLLSKITLLFRNMPICHLGCPKIRGTRFGGPHNKDYSILGSVSQLFTGNDHIFNIPSHYR